MENNSVIQVIAFKLANEEYALPITRVQEIIMFQQTTRIPQTAEFIEGFINLRGIIIPIVDARKRFGLEIKKESENSRIMILELEKSTIGLIVDSISEVVELNNSNIEKLPIETGEKNSFIEGVAKLSNKLYILIDPGKLFNNIEAQKIANTMKVAADNMEKEKMQA